MATKKLLLQTMLLVCFPKLGKATVSTSDIFESRITKLSMYSDETQGFVNRRLYMTREYELMRFWESLVAKSGESFGEVLKKSFSKPKLWAIWFGLYPSERERVISQLYPLLAENDGPSLYCSDAYNLCLADNNCRWKYWNFQSACFGQTYSLEEWIAETEFRLNLLVPRVRIRRKTPKYLRKFGKSRRNRKTRRRRARKSRYKQRVALFLSQKKFRQALKDATMGLHYWMGRYWPNVYSKSFSKKQQCSSRCQNALLMLNKTVYAGLLATCDCRAKSNKHNQSQMNFLWDERQCKKQQAKAIECRPRLFKPSKAVIGCTASRLKCESDLKCSKAQEYFLLKCSQVINNKTCTDACREAIDRLSSASKHFGTCVCDGSEMRECQGIRENLSRLCTLKTNSFKTKNDQSISRRTTRSVLNYNNGAFTINYNFYFMIEAIFVANFLFFHIFAT